MKIAIIGAGSVGQTLGRGLAAAGHDVTYGVRDPGANKHDEAKASGARFDTIAAAVEACELALLATPWAAAQAAVEAAGDFGGRPLLDATNPIGPGFTLAHGHTDSGAEQVARWAKNAKVVKVFNTTGVENLGSAGQSWPGTDGRGPAGTGSRRESEPGGAVNMAQPRYGEARAAMCLCGDDAAARETAARLAADLGFEPLDAGPLSNARLLEPAALLWIDLALRRGQGRNFAFGVLRR